MSKEASRAPEDTCLPTWNIRRAVALDWNVRGGNGPGVERPGPQKEEETAAERREEEHVNSMDQHGPDGEGQDGREKGSGRRRSKRKSGQPRGTRTRTTGGAAHQGRYIRGEAAMEKSVWSSRRKKRRRRQESTRGKGCVHGSQGRWRDRTRRAREGKREEKEKQTRGTRSGTSVGRRPGTGASGEAAVWDRIVRGCTRRGIR